MNQTTEILVKKTILISLSTLLIALGITLFLESSLGSDPLTIWVDGLRHSLGISMGNASFLNNGVTLLLAAIFARKFIHLGTVIGALAIGPLMDWFAPGVEALAGFAPGLWIRVVMILVGQFTICFGVALNLTVKFGFGTTDALLVRLCERFHLKYRNLKLLSDLSYALAGILLGGVFGIGSVVAVLTGGPIISWFMETGARALVAMARIPEPITRVSVVK